MRTGPRPSGVRGLFASALALGLLMPAAVTMAPARAATETFSESFSGASLETPENWISSKGTSSKVACLTALAEGSTITLPNSQGTIDGCPHAGTGALDEAGSGVLRLTDDAVGQSAAVLYREPQPMSDGLDITFSFAMHSGLAAFGTSGADGFTFFIKDGSNSDDSPGTGGGALGYALEVSNASSRGIRGGLLGVGFDFFGAYSIQETNSTGRALNCAGTTPSIVLHSGDTNRNNATDRVVLRGPDLSSAQDGSCGYEYLGRTAAPVDFGRAVPGVTTSPPAMSRGDAARRARIVIDKPGPNALIKVWVWNVGDPEPASPVREFEQPSELEGVPTFKFGFAAGTGGATNIHEIWDLQIVLADPVVQAVRAAAATGSAPPAGIGLACAPDPVSPGAEVACVVTAGPAGAEILWRASIADRPVDSRGVTIGADGTAEFRFIAPADGLGSTIDVELVEWEAETTVQVTGRPVPTRVNAGGGPGPLPMGAVETLLIAVALFGLGSVGRSRGIERWRATSTLRRW